MTIPKSEQTRTINFILFNSIVPKHFLGGFFDFIFDIYKLNFDCCLPDDLYNEFKFIYEGTRGLMRSDDDEIHVDVTKRNYQLARATKQLVLKNDQIDEVIDLSIIVVKLIDKFYWNQPINIRNPYLMYGYEKWVQKHGKTDNARQDGHKIKSRWKPEIFLEHNNIYLVPPVHQIHSSTDYQDIKIVVMNDEEILYSNCDPEIREIIGGYQVTTENIRISKPLGKLKYLIKIGNKTIYDSKDALYRNYIVFDQKGREIKNHTDYEGAIEICAASSITGNSYFCDVFYCLDSMTVTKGERKIICGDDFIFAALVKPGIDGNKIVNQFIRREDSKELIQVFSEIECLIFDSDNDSEHYEIDINDNKYMLSDLEHDKTFINGVWRFNVVVPIETAGIYTLTAYNTDNHRRRKIIGVKFAYDPYFKIDEVQIDKENYLLDVRSGILENDISAEINIRSFAYDWLGFEYNGQNYRYIIPIVIDIYRVNDSEWRTYDESIVIGEIKPHSEIEVYGNDYDEVYLYSSEGVLLENAVKTNSTRTSTIIPADFMKSYQVKYDFVYLALLKNGRVDKTIFCYNRCVMDKKTVLQYDFSTGKLLVIPRYYGQGNVGIEIKKSDGETVFKAEELKSGKSFKIDGLKSFVDYGITFYEKSEGLLISENRKLMGMNTMFFAKADLTGRAYKIDHIKLEMEDHGQIKSRKQKLNNVYALIKKRIYSDVYEGDIAVKNNDNSLRYFNDVNPVKIEICSDVIDNKVEAIITKDGDGLLYDKENKSILNTLDDYEATDIYSYSLDIKGAAEA